MNEGWEYKKLGDVCTIISGQDYKSIQDDNGLYPIYGSGGLMGYATQFRCPPNSVIIGRKGNINNPILVEKPFWNVDTAFGIVTKEEIILPKFFFFFCKNYDFNKHNVAVTIPSLRRVDIVKIDVPVPPLAEQKLIVEELDLLSDIIEKQKQQLKELDTLAQSIFYDMFGDPVTNEKGWEKKQLESVCKIICGQDHKPVKDEGGAYPIYGSGGFMGYASQYRCPENSVVIGRKGNINSPIFVDQKFWNIDTAFGIVSDKKFLHPLFFFYFCKNYDFTKHDVSVTIPSLRRTDILKIIVILPPLSLQNLFAEKIEAIEKQKEAIGRSIEEMQKLFDYTMDKYFG